MTRLDVFRKLLKLKPIDSYTRAVRVIEAKADRKKVTLPRRTLRIVVARTRTGTEG